MDRFFSLDNPIWNFLGKVWDVLWLTILWFVCSLPIITFGASTTAFYYVGLKLVKNEEGYVTKQFFHSFRQNFLQGSLLGLLVLLLGLALAFNIRFFASAETAGYKILFLLMLMCGWVYIIIIHYIFAALAQFHNTLRRLVAFSFMIALRKLGWTILMIGINLIILLSCSYFLPLFLAVPGLIVVSNCGIIKKCFAPYVEQA